MASSTTKTPATVASSLQPASGLQSRATSQFSFGAQPSAAAPSGLQPFSGLQSQSSSQFSFGVQPSAAASSTPLASQSVFSGQPSTAASIASFGAQTAVAKPAVGGQPRPVVPPQPFGSQPVVGQPRTSAPAAPSSVFAGQPLTAAPRPSVTGPPFGVQQAAPKPTGQLSMMLQPAGNTSQPGTALQPTTLGRTATTAFAQSKPASSQSATLKLTAPGSISAGLPATSMPFGQPLSQSTPAQIGSKSQISESQAIRSTLQTAPTRTQAATVTFGTLQGNQVASSNAAATCEHIIISCLVVCRKCVGFLCKHLLHIVIVLYFTVVKYYSSFLLRHEVLRICM